MTAGGVNAWLRADAAQGHGAVAAALGTAALGMSIIGLAISERGIALAPGLPAWLALAGFVGLATMAVAAWVVQSERPGVAIGLSVTLVGLALPSWTAWDWVPGDIVPGLLATAPLAVAGAGHVGLGWAPRTTRPRALVAVYLLAAAGAVLIALAYDPLADPGCAFTCADGNPVAASLITTRAAVTATAALLLAGAAVSAWSLAQERRAPPLLRLCVAAGVGLLVAGWAAHVVRWADPIPGFVRVVPQVVAAMLLAVVVLVSWWAVRRSRIIAERLVADLNVPADGSRSHGGHTVEFAIPDEDRWVDTDGRPVPSQATRDGKVALEIRGEPAVRVRLTPGAAAPALDAISQAARVALGNARLTAVIRARLADVRDSRRRIVRASDAERLRMARDLHDGAQQRLISASLHVSIAASQVPTPMLERAQTTIGEALEQLRRLAHGLVPDTLRAEGLRAGLDDLVRDSDVPAVLEMADVAVDDDVGLAIHAAVAAVLEHANSASARTVRVEVGPLLADRIGLRIEAGGPSGLGGWDETSVADRIGAVDGTLTVHADATQLVVSAELPCVS
jgi:signal transduction histidine kinase